MSERISVRRENNKYRVYLSNEATFLTITQLPGRRWRVNAGPQPLNTLRSRDTAMRFCNGILEPELFLED